MLGPPGRSVAERQLDGARLLEVFEVAARSAAADARPLGDVDGGDARGGATHGVEHEGEGRRRDSLREPSAALGAEEREEVIDVLLARLAQALEAPAQRGVALEPVAEGVEQERLDEVLDDPSLHRGPQRVDVLCGRDGDYVDRRLMGAKSPDHVQAGYVRQIDVQQHELRLQPVDEEQCLGAGVRFADHAEAGYALGVRPMDGRGHEVVVDDEDVEHVAATWRSRCGRNAVKTAPPSFSTRTQPPRRRFTVWLTSARPRPRRPVPAATFVVKPSRKMTSISAGSMPGPVSRTRTSTPSGSSRIVTSISPPPFEPTESSALSTRLPTTVTSSRASGQSSGRRVPSPTCRSIPRSDATAALPSSSASSVGSPTLSTIDATSAWWTSEDCWTNSTASS